VKRARSILLVDDDVELCALMAEYLTGNGYQLDVAYDGREGLARALHDAWDLIILDVMLPVLDGFEVLRQIRMRSTVPVIMLTARTLKQDRITGLEAGADDYLPKPFVARELLARIRAVLRRAGHFVPLAPSIFEVGDIRVNVGTREVWRGGERIGLTSIEFDILNLLMHSAGRVVSRDQIATVLYHREMTPYERAVDVHISHLRRKLEREDQTLIQTVRGSGYLFLANE
jgi:two-component system response regulator CpxR